jgi:serine/threonine protein kinase
VYQALEKLENKTYAIKKIYLHNLEKSDVLTEATILDHISHNNIVKYHSWWIEEATSDEKRQSGYNTDVIHPQLKLNE